MADLIYFQDCYVREWTAVVEDRRRSGVFLDRTAFYPEGGGQPGDTGAMAWAVGLQSKVRKVVKDSGDVLHLIEGSVPETGVEVCCTLDWERRYAHMRYHTAQHLLSAYFLSEHGASTSGNQISFGKGTIDFNLDSLDVQMARRAEEQLSAWIRMSLPVEITMIPRDEALSRLNPERTRVDRLPSSVETLRVVKIGDVDEVACAGTHVRNTAELGRPRVTGTSSSGQGRRRLEFILN